MKKIIFIIILLLELLCTPAARAYNHDEEGEILWDEPEEMDESYRQYRKYRLNDRSQIVHAFTQCDFPPDVATPEDYEMWKKVRDKMIDTFLERVTEYKNVGIWYVVNPEGKIVHVEPENAAQRLNPDEHNMLAMRIVKAYPKVRPAYNQKFELDAEGNYCFDEEGSIIVENKYVYYIGRMIIGIWPIDKEETPGSL